MKKLLCSVAVVGLLLVPLSVSGQVTISPEVVLADNVDFGIGGTISFPLEDLNENIEGFAGFDLFFPDAVDYWQITGGLRYLIEIDNPDVLPFLGAGLGIGNFSFDVPEGSILDGSSTEIGLLLGGGAKFNTSSSVQPWAEFLIGVGDLPDFAIRVGAGFELGG